MAVVTGTNWNAYDAATMTSREIYGRTLAELGKHNEKIVGLTADLAKTTAIVHFAKADVYKRQKYDNVNRAYPQTRCRVWQHTNLEN